LTLDRGLSFELALEVLESGGLVQEKFENLKSNLSETEPKKAHF
jgi:hypothetical protein